MQITRKFSSYESIWWKKTYFDSLHVQQEPVS